MTLSETQAVDRLLDRFGFGATPARRAQARAAGLGGAARMLLAPARPDPAVAATPPPPLQPVTRLSPGADVRERRMNSEAHTANRNALIRWWLGRMVSVQDATEKLTFFWHGHFATSARKVRSAQLMLAQNETLRTHALGSFTDLARAILVDPAMIQWLDGQESTVKSPNENLAREFMELFTLGTGRYTEKDVREGARALTGWVIQDGRAVLRKALQDTNPKTIFGQTGPYDTDGFADLVLARPEVADFITTRLWFRLMGAEPAPATARIRMLSAYGKRGDLTAMLLALVQDGAFRQDSFSLVRSPVEWLVGLMKAFEVRFDSLDPARQGRYASALTGMGQGLFIPPSVGGWPPDRIWLSTAATVSRSGLAQQLVDDCGFPDEARGATPPAVADRLAQRLGVTWSPRTRGALEAAGSPSNALIVAACSPEVVVSR